MKRKIHWFNDDELQIDIGRGVKGRTCQDCGQVVRESRIPSHGLPDTRTQCKLNSKEIDALLECCVKAPTYVFASALHERSLVAKDLLLYCGDMKRIVAALSSINGRIRVASDIIYLRSVGSLRMRMSMHRETDRFTKL